MNHKLTSPLTTRPDPKIESARLLSVSVVIPVLNEGSQIEQSVAKAWQAGADEVIVADGGSTDQTVALAEKSDCLLVKSASGRGRQLNAGAEVATGDILMFLHADNWLESNAAQQIRNAMQDDQCVGGGFMQRIESKKFVFRMVEYGNYFRAKRQRLVYGDQGLFIRRSVFDSLGGFPDIPLMEDFAFSQALFQDQRKPVILPGPLHVDPRLWEKTGVVRQTLRNWRFAAAYRFGASPESLYRRYYQD